MPTWPARRSRSRQFGPRGTNLVRMSWSNLGQSSSKPHSGKSRPRQTAAKVPSVLIIVVLVIFTRRGRPLRRMDLVIPELSVNAVFRKQLRMRAALDRPAPRDHDDLVHLDHRGQTMG